MSIVVLALGLLGAGGLPVVAQTTVANVAIELVGDPCTRANLTAEASFTSPSGDHSYLWTLTNPSGETRNASTTIHKLTIESFETGMVGQYNIDLKVLDGARQPVGHGSRSFFLSECGGATMTGEPHPDCYDERYGFYDCDRPPWTPSPGCELYRDEQGNWVERCQATPTTSPVRYDSEACRALQNEQDQFYSDWKYEYYAYYERAGTEPGSDEAFERNWNQKRESYAADWQSRWEANGCHQPYSSPDCGEDWERAQLELGALKEKWTQAWQTFYTEMEGVRAQWGSLSEEERALQEEAWRQRVAGLTDRYYVELRNLAERYGFLGCGFNEEDHRLVRPAFAISEMRAMSPADSAREECYDRVFETKDLYRDQLESLRMKVQAAQPGTTEYDEALRELQALMEKLALEGDTIVAACRLEAAEGYDAPDRFRDGMGSLQCFYVEDVGKIVCEGKYVGFLGDPQTQFISRYTCGGQPVFDDLYSNQMFTDFEFIEDQDAASLLIRSESLKLVLHDGPRGVINVGAVGDAELYVIPSPHLTIMATDGRVHIEGNDGWTADWIGLGAGDVAWDPLKGVITVKGEATWVASSCRPDGSDPDGDLSDDYFDAIKARRLGAQVTIRLDGEAADHDEEDYSGMDVGIEHQGGRRFLATIDSAAGECQTVVLKFDDGIFDTIRLRVSMTDESGAEINVEEADDLGDVLDPCDDGEQGFEYWVVQDRHGTQLLLSFAHFSEKRVSVEAASVGNVIVPGFGASTGALAVAVAAFVLFAVRRRFTR